MKIRLMNDRAKTRLGARLRTAARVALFTGLVPLALPLYAQEPPEGSRDAALLSPADPFLPMNRVFREAYAELRGQVLAKTTPIIVQIGGALVLLRNGARTEAPALSARYHELKAVAHIPLTLYVMLTPAADAKLDLTRMDKLRQYRGLVVQSRASLAGRGFRPEQLARQLRIVDRSLEFIDQTVRAGAVSSTKLRRFTRSQSDDIQANTYEAAEDQIETMERQVQAWLREMSLEEKARLHIIVSSPHMPRVGNLAMQYFSVVLGEPYEGRYEEEEEKKSDFRLIYSEALREEQDILRVLGTHRVDADIGVYFFDDAQRMHRDLLADPAEQIIRKRFGKR